MLCAEPWTAVEIGGQVVEPGTGLVAMLAGFSATGELLFNRTLPLACNALDVSPDGIIVLSGELSGVVDLGGGDVGAAGASAIVYAQFAADGTLLDNAAYVGTGPSAGRAIAVHPDRGVVLAGAASGTVDFGFQQVAPGPGFIAWLDIVSPN